MSKILTKSASFNSILALNPFHNVEIFVSFLSIGEIDTMNERFSAEVLIECEWIDNSVNENYDSNKNWNPKLYIENALSDCKETVSYTLERKCQNVIIKESRHLKGSFWERLELDKFPLDIQELSIIITSKYNRSELSLISNFQKLSYLEPEALNTFRDQQKWISEFYYFLLNDLHLIRVYYTGFIKW